tara:strand:+ start:1924 stop:2892 length:969 start_codon:yes stop_codon:yes gene_type:complete
MSLELLSGVTVPVAFPLVTPKEFSHYHYERLMNVLAQAKIPVAFINGFTGQTYDMDNKTRLSVMYTASTLFAPSRERNPGMKFIVGVNGDTDAEFRENIALAHQLKYDGIVVQPSRMDVGGDVVKFMKGVESELPIILYSCSGTAKGGEVITPDTITELSYIDNVVGVKVSEDFETHVELCGRRTHPEFYFSMGNAYSIFDLAERSRDVVANKTVGVVSGPANVFPKAWVKMWDLIQITALDSNPDLGQDMAGQYTFQKNFLYEFKNQHESIPDRVDMVSFINYLLTKKGIFSEPSVLDSNKNVAFEQEPYLNRAYDVLSSK